MVKTLRSWAEGQKLLELSLRLLKHIDGLNGEENSTTDYDSVSEMKTFLEELDDISDGNS